MFLLLFSLIFIMRYIAIWALVILSPLAFFAYVLPGTKKYFTLWWSQFLQWAFVGVSAAFFLYLAEQLLVTMSTTPFIAAPTPPIGILQPLTDIFNTVMVYIVIEAFLAFGFLASLSSGAVGAGAVISTGKQWTSAATKSVAGWAGKTGKGYARKALEESGLAKGAMNIAQRMATLKTPGTGVPGVKGTLQRAAGGVFAEGIRLVGRGGMGFLESGRKEIGEAEGEVEKASVDMVISKFRSAAEWSKKVGYLNRLIKKGDLGDALKKGLTEGEINQALVHAQRYDSHQEILNAMPHLPEAQQIMRRNAAATALAIPPSAVTAAQMAAVTPAQLQTAYQGSVFRKMKPERAGQISLDVFNVPANRMIADAAVLGWDGRQVGKLVEVQGQPAVDSIRDTIHRLASTSVPPMSDKEWLEGKPAVAPGVLFVGHPGSPAVPGHNPSIAKYVANATQSFFKFDGAGNIT